jgi:CRISPR/Cas system CSM-associated protein Csm3 (group 7 of RAMP superfamily)
MNQDRMAGAGGVRPIQARWVICGELLLESACHLGNGDRGERVDLPLLRDRAEGRPLLLGTSVAGALRSYASDRLCGYSSSEDGRVSELFGGRRGDEDGSQSPLVVFDSLSGEAAAEVRDGVALDATRGTAAEHLKFDQEVLPAGTRFPLRLELVITEPGREADLLELLAVALSGFHQGDIPIGARRSRGFGECSVSSWRVKRFDLSSQAGWLAWLASDHLDPLAGTTPCQEVVAALRTPGAEGRAAPDRRDHVRIELRLSFRGGLLVRSPGLQADSADASHLHSGGHPVLPGTSLAGALRARATKIARLVREPRGDADRWVERLFGPRKPEDRGRQFHPRASRLRTSERRVRDARSLRVARIRIDRFTSGVVDGGLFDEEPAYLGRTDVSLILRSPLPGELGLLLLVLKDLLDGDLSVGGSGSVGRGVVAGSAELHLPGREHPVTLNPEAAAEEATVTLLNGHVRQFHEADIISEGT